MALGLVWAHSVACQFWRVHSSLSIPFIFIISISMEISIAMLSNYTILEMCKISPCEVTADTHSNQ